MFHFNFGQYKTIMACGLWTGYKIQTRYKTRTTVGMKRRLQTGYKIRTKNYIGKKGANWF